MDLINFARTVDVGVSTAAPALPANGGDPDVVDKDVLPETLVRRPLAGVCHVVTTDRRAREVLTIDACSVVVAAASPLADPDVLPTGIRKLVVNVPVDVEALVQYDRGFEAVVINADCESVGVLADLPNLKALTVTARAMATAHQVPFVLAQTLRAVQMPRRPLLTGARLDVLKRSPATLLAAIDDYLGGAVVLNTLDELRRFGEGGHGAVRSLTVAFPLHANQPARRRRCARSSTATCRWRGADGQYDVALNVVAIE